MKIIVFLVYQIGQLTPTGSKLCSKTINKGYPKYNPHKNFWFWSTMKWATNALKITHARVSHTPTVLNVLHREGVECCSLFVSLWILAAFFFFSIIFTVESKWIWVDWLHPSQFPPICFSKKHHCTNGLYYFSRTESFNSPKNRFIKCTWFRVFCTCFLCWVCRLIKSERSGESPSLSARRLCKTCTLNESFCKERDGLASLKNSFGKRLAKYSFLLFGDC